VAAKEQELISVKTETSAAINSLQGKLSSEKEEWVRKRREMQAQIDYTGSELDRRDLEIAELRDRLKKREDENTMLKGEAKGHVQRIDA
jgi:peptidoglycan hydrolase CwlO-like protein